VGKTDDKRSVDENYFCHIIIPSKVRQRSKIFYERVFGWKVKQQPGTTSMDVLPRFRKGPSAELNSDVEVIVPSILTSDIDAKLRLIEKFGGKKLTNKTLIGKSGEHGCYALFEDPQGNKMCLYSRK
jgi:predicted enzyme related to lactoylglutathione lyase